MPHIHEAGRDVPVFAECDVLVAGGGVSGCAAAVGAARAGASVVLVERNGILGGVATASLMGSFCNMFVAGDGRIVMRGFAGEVTDRLAAMGAASPLAKHPEVPGFPFDCECLKTLLIEMCQEAGARILTHAVAASAIMDGRRVAGAFVEGKSGRQAVLARNTVDCTGEADLLAQAGAEMETFHGSASTLFQMAPVDIDALVGFIESQGDAFPKGMDWVRDAAHVAGNWRERGVLFLPHGGGAKWEFVQQFVRAGDFQSRAGDFYDLDALGMYGFRGRDFVYVNSNFRRPGLNTDGLARCEVEAQKLCWQVGDFLRRHMPGFGRARVTQTGCAAGYRAARKIVGQERMLKAWLQSPLPLRRPDGIGRILAATPPPHTSAQTSVTRPNHTCDIPFGVLAPKGVENILCGSGKSVCQEEFILRNMPKCMTLGQAAGAAAAVASRAGLSASRVDVGAVRRELARQGVDLGEA